MNVLEKINELEGELEYVCLALRSELEAWERKDYSSLKEDCEREIAALKAHVEKHRDIFFR
ncbi:MAG: hypothetical protein LBJ72_10710 [Dysgonamonadaceae bacterium]|jgi:hypothetical protein|nr:hypothetical protein [Dysgonamonadaceae bacterium]